VSVFMAGLRPTESITLDPARHPLPWRWESAGTGDNQVLFEGAPELFFARTPADFDAILPLLKTAEEVLAKPADEKP